MTLKAPTLTELSSTPRDQRGAGWTAEAVRLTCIAQAHANASGDDTGIGYDHNQEGQTTIDHPALGIITIHTMQYIRILDSVHLRHRSHSTTQMTRAAV